MTDTTYTKIFEQIYKKVEEHFFEEVYNLNSIRENERVFETIYKQHLTECTAQKLYTLVSQYKDSICNEKERQFALDKVIIAISESGKEIFEPSDKTKHVITSFFKELDTLYWKDKDCNVGTDTLINCLYYIFRALKNGGYGGVPESLLRKTEVAGITMDFLTANHDDYDKALLQFLQTFFNEDSRADFSKEDKNERKKYAAKFKKLGTEMKRSQSDK